MENRRAASLASDNAPDRESPVPMLSRRIASAQSHRRFRYRTSLTRERDVCRHLQPWCDLFKPKTIHRHAFPETQEQPLHKPEPCPDTALAAFAQLTALRMSARRCLVSLISADTAWILTDTTQSMSLQHDALIEDSKNRMWIGTCRFPRKESPNDEALELWQKAREMREEPTEHDYFYTQGISQHWSIVSDARAVEGIQKLEFMRRTPGTRFLASVPLRSAHGSVIGALTVMDDIPRFGVSCTEMAYLEDIADTIVEHLGATMARAQSERSERLIQAIGLFNSGKDSLRDWWLAQDDAKTLGTGRHAYKGDENDRQARLHVEFGNAEMPPEENDDSSGGPIAQADYFDFGYANNAAPSAQTQTKRFGNPRRSVKSGVMAGNTFDLASSSAEYYARASNLLRESMRADGVVFVDAKSAPSSLLRVDSEESETGYMSNAISAASEASDSASDSSRWCEIHGFSTRVRSSVGGSASDAGGIKLRDTVCQRLIKRYPKGIVFHYDQSGDAHASSDDSNSDTTGSESGAARKMGRKDGVALGRAFKGARTIALYPLWDVANERWRSCVVAWSTSADRYFTRDEDLTYLATFGHSLLAGLSRLESLAADNAKGTFISSVSHELRSPLHGIMAGLEFLQDSDLTKYQQEMTHAVSVAARTLLDTINHVLDYSRISNYGRARKTMNGYPAATTLQDGASKKGSFDEFNTLSRVDLAQLVEEVVETTVAAHRSQYQNPTSGAPRTRTSDSDARRTWQYVTASELAVTCNISARRNWVAELHPGGLTRIITNLLGNALKYTDKGTVSVHLKAGESLHVGQRERCPVTLIVEDTGRGIGEVFQANGLFTPFAQEDPHSTGTGLGLSIVRQIADEMDAQLNLTSTRGTGTTVTLSFMASIGPEGSSEDVSQLEDFDSSPLPRLDVSHFHLICTEAEAITHIGDNHSVGNSVLRLAKHWLDCNTSSGPHVTPVDGNSVCAIMEDELLALRLDNAELLQHMLEKAAQHHSHILVLGRSIQSLSPTIRLGPKIGITPVFVHQPIGPRKLLRAITSDHSSIEPRPSSSRANSVDQRYGDALPGSSMIFSEHNRDSDQYVLATTPCDTTRNGSASGGSMSDRKGVSTNDQPAPSSWHLSATTSDFDLESPSLSTIIESSQGVNESGTSIRIVERNKILLVEDNDINMKLLVALMRKLKLEYHCACNGREAIDLYRKNSRVYFLVLMDISMPVMDGYTATAKIRAFEKRRPQLHRATIVALTGVTSPEAKARAFDSGVDEFYPKPVRMKELKNLVDRIRE